MDENEYIIEFYNKKTDERIGYLCFDFDIITYITEDIYKSTYFSKKLFDTFKNLSITFINEIYGEKIKGTMKEHDYEHIKEDFFKNIKKEYVSYRFLNKDIELRRLKLNKLRNEK